MKPLQKSGGVSKNDEAAGSLMTGFLKIGIVKLTAGTLKSVAGCLILLNGSAASADELVFRSDRVDEAFQGGAANYSSQVLELPEYRAYRQAFIYLYQRYPDLPQEQAIEWFQRWRTRFIEIYRPGDPSPPGQPGSGIPRFDRFDAALDIGGSIPGLDQYGIGLIAASIRQTKEFFEVRRHQRMAENYRITSLFKQGFTIEAEREAQRRANETASSMHRNPNFAGIDSFLMQDSARRAIEIMDAHPEWAANSSILVSTCNDTRYMAGCCGWHETRPKLHVVRKPGNSWSGWLAVGPNPSK